MRNHLNLSGTKGFSGMWVFSANIETVPDSHSPLWCSVLAPDENLVSLPSSTAALSSLPLADADLELGPFSVVTPPSAPT